MMTTEHESRLIEQLKKGIPLSGINAHMYYQKETYYKIEFCTIVPNAKIALVLLRITPEGAKNREITFQVDQMYEVAQGKMKPIKESKLLNKQLVFKHTCTSYNMELGGSLFGKLYLL